MLNTKMSSKPSRTSLPRHCKVGWKGFSSSFEAPSETVGSCRRHPTLLPRLLSQLGGLSLPSCKPLWRRIRADQFYPRAPRRRRPQSLARLHRSASRGWMGHDTHHLDEARDTALQEGPGSDFGTRLNYWIHSTENGQKWGSGHKKLYTTCGIAAQECAVLD